MRRGLSPLLPALLMLLMLTAAGCNSAGKNASKNQNDVRYTFFYTYVDHMNELLEAGKVVEASGVYARQYSEEKELDPEEQAVIDRLARELAAQERPAAKSALQRLRSAPWPADPDQYDTMKSALENARRVASSIRSHAILLRPEYSLAALSELESALQQTEAEALADAPREFDEYPISVDENFFDAYPVKLDAKAFVAENTALWNEQIDEASIEGIIHIHRTYRHTLPDDMRSRCAERFLALKMPDREDSGLECVLSAVDGCHDAGFDVERIPGVNIAFVQMSSQSLLKKGQIEFPISFDIDLPVEAEKKALEEAFSSETAGKADILVMVNVALAKCNRYIEFSEKRESKVQVGVEKEMNPDYVTAKAELDQANLSAMSVGNTYTYSTNPYAGLANSLSQIIAGAAAAKRKETAMEKLKSTPMYLEKPIYQPYHYRVAEVKASRTATVYYYIVDRKNRTWIRDVFDVQQKQVFDVAYNVNDADPDRDFIVASHDSEQDVARWEEAPLGVPLSELLDAALAKQPRAKRLKTLAAVQKQVVADRNSAVAQYKENDYGVDPREDSRFDSVVALYSASNSGSGFYVRDDMVLTNHHVVEGKEFFNVVYYDGSESFGKVVAMDVRQDLALIKVQKRGKPVKFFAGRRLPVGGTVEAIGAPHNYEFTLTRGVISAVREHASVSGMSGKDVLYVQTDCPINAGNSGGPLFMGETVIGVNDWKDVTKNTEGLAFSIHNRETFDFLKRHNIQPILEN